VVLVDQPTMRSVELSPGVVGVMASHGSGQAKKPTETQVLPWKVTHTVVTLNEPDAYGVNHMLEQLDDLADAGLPERLAEQAHRVAGVRRLPTSQDERQQRLEAERQERIDRALSVTKEVVAVSAAIIGAAAGIKGLRTSKGSSASALGRWLRKHLATRKPISEPIYTEVRVPVLLLGAPDVPDARVAWTTTRAATSNRGLRITVLGAGYGANTIHEVSQEITEECRPGQVKKITACLPVRLTPMAFVYRGKPVFEFTQAEIADPAPENLPERWVAEYCDLAEVRPLLIPGNQVLDRTGVPGDIVTQKNTAMASSTHTLSLGISAKLGATPLEMKLSAEVCGSARYEIVYALPGGYAYRQFTPRDSLGLIWTQYDC